jgi:predicted NBD/HSP70 family sugar kinase
MSEINLLPEPKFLPELHPTFRPAVLVNLAFEAVARDTGAAAELGIALEQTDGSVFHHHTVLFPEGHELAENNFLHLERLVKFLLWSRGGWRIHLTGSPALAEQLQCYYRETELGKFDNEVIGSRNFGKSLEVVACNELPAEKVDTKPLGRHLDGCRIGFDLGGSDRKAAAVIDGEVVFSEEIEWDPYFEPDPNYHYEGIVDSLKKAAAHLPRVDAIGGSAAGCYSHNRVTWASLFRGVPEEAFDSQVRGMFLKIQADWGVPLEVINDGEVTALAGSMALGKNGVLGIAMGTSQGGGYIDMDGHITTWLSELAFAPVDLHPAAPPDEWSGDLGCGAQYFSQQAVGRLLPASGIEYDASLSLPEQLKIVQAAMDAGDERALKIYDAIGIYLGYSLAHYAEFYDFEYVLLLGRVTTGPGGEHIIARSKEVMAAEFPELAERIKFHIPDEMEKRHGQAIAAASLPKIG